MAKIAIVGGGGFAAEVIEVALMLGHEIVGIYATRNSLKEYEHLGYLDEMKSSMKSFDAVHIAIGAVNREGIANRRGVIDFLKRHGIPSISLVSPKNCISESVEIGEGVYIGHEVLISCNSRIDDFVLINQRATIGHDCRVEENVSIAPLVFLGGNVSVGRDSMIGVGAIARQGISIGENSIVGMGSLLIRSIKAGSTTLQLPSRVLKKSEKI